MISNILILAISATLLVLTGIIFQKSRKYHTNIKYLIGSLVCIAIANTAVGLNLYNILIIVVMTSLLPLGIVLIFFHYESISHARPRLSLSIFLLGLYFFLVSFKLLIPLYMSLKDISLGVSYINLREIDDIFIQTLLRMSNFLQSLIICTVFIFAFSTMIKELKIVKIKTILIESIGLMFLILYGSLYLIRDVFFYENYYEIFTSVALIFSLIGILLIISNFIMHPDYLYYIPFSIYNFMIFNEGGTLCYVRKVQKLDNEKPKKHLEHLLAGAFTAVSNMFKEVLGAGANIRYIDAESFIILVTSLPDKRGVFVVISRGETALFKSSIKRFARTLSPQLLKEINGHVDLNELRSKIDTRIKDSFPYVVFS